MQIVLYYSPIACSMVPYISLTEAGAKFEVRNINLGKGQQMSADYLKINPKHKVPLLVVDGKTLTENVAMALWMSRQFPAAKLLPSDPWQEVQALSIMSWCSGGIHPFLTRLNAPAKVCDFPGSEAAVRKAATAALEENFRIADEMLAGREYFFDHFTAADAHFFWTFRRASQFNLDLSGYKNCNVHHERLKGRDSVKQLLAYEAQVMAEFAKAA